MRKPLRLAVTALSGRVMAGTANAAENGLNGRQDVTSDFLKCVVDKANLHGGGFDIEGDDGNAWTVSVSKNKEGA